MNSLEEKMERYFSYDHLRFIIGLFPIDRVARQLEVSEQDIRKYVKKYKIHLGKKNSKSYYPGKESMIK